MLLSSWVYEAQEPALALLTHRLPGPIFPSELFLADAFSLYLKLKYLAGSLVHLAIHIGTSAFYKVFKLKSMELNEVYE